MGGTESKPQLRGEDWLCDRLLNASGLESSICCCRQDASSGGASLIRIAREPGGPRGAKSAFKTTVNRRLSTLTTLTDSSSPVDKLEELVNLHREGNTHFAILLSCIDASDTSVQSTIVFWLAQLIMPMKTLTVATRRNAHRRGVQVCQDASASVVCSTQLAAALRRHNQSVAIQAASATVSACSRKSKAVIATLTLPKAKLAHPNGMSATINLPDGTSPASRKRRIQEETRPVVSNALSPRVALISITCFCSWMECLHLNITSDLLVESCMPP